MKVTITIEDRTYERRFLDSNQPIDLFVKDAATKCRRCDLCEECLDHGAPICDFPDGRFMDSYYKEC